LIPAQLHVPMFELKAYWSYPWIAYEENKTNIFQHSLQSPIFLLEQEKNENHQD